MVSVTIAQQFSSHPITAITPLGNGLINDTFLVSQADNQWVLQRINSQVFSRPDWIMHNLQRLTRHIQTKPSQLLIPAVLPTLTQTTYWQATNGDCWRALAFIPKSVSKEQLDNDQEAAQIGWALGHFHALCSDLLPEEFYDTLPGFHNAPHYWQQLQHALLTAKVPLDADYQFCLSYLQANQAQITVLEAAKAQSELHLQITHGDPKVNNFLFAADRSQIISLIDLDTVKPGLWHYDIGDCLRACCHRVLDNSFDITRAEIILEAYCAQMGQLLSEADYHYLHAAIELIPFELGMRFFTDYLQGNRYFKVNGPKQNLTRAVQQLTLSASIKAQRQPLRRLIQDLQRRGK